MVSYSSRQVAATSPQIGLTLSGKSYSNLRSAPLEKVEKESKKTK